MYGVGGMYGGTMGMGGMYGAGGYGLGGGMYGSGMYGGGMNSGLYNGGGLSGGLYNSSINGGYGSSLYNNNNNNNGLLCSSTLGNGNANNSSGSLLDCNGNNNANSQGVGLLPPQPSNGANPSVNANELSSPINQVAALPPLNEDPADRARRLRNERRKRHQLIKQHRDQLRQVKMKARLEILGHFTNVLVQTLRSTMELFAVCFGTYYSMKAVRAFSGAQEVPPGYVRAPNGQLIPAIGGSNPKLQLSQQQQQAVSNGASANSVSNSTEHNILTQGKRSKWKQWIIFTSLMVLGEILFESIKRAWVRRQSNVSRYSRNALYNEYNDPQLDFNTSKELHRYEEEELAHHYHQQHSRSGLFGLFNYILGVKDHHNALESNSLASLSSEEEYDETMEEVYSNALEQTTNNMETARRNRDGRENYSNTDDNNGIGEASLLDRNNNTNRRVYVAMYDYDGSKEGDEFAIFKSGDEFIVDEYVDDGWCEAVRFNDNTHISNGGMVLVPGNFLRPLGTSTKL